MMEVAVTSRFCSLTQSPCDSVECVNSYFVRYLRLAFKGYRIQLLSTLRYLHGSSDFHNESYIHNPYFEANALIQTQEVRVSPCTQMVPTGVQRAVACSDWSCVLHSVRANTV